MALQIAIVEDLQPDAQRLQALVRQELGAVECGIFPSGDAYLQQMPARKDDLVFLDICMEGTSGIETAQQLRRADPKVLIVFVTSSPEYVWDAFPVHPFDYLLKPYEEENFMSCNRGIVINMDKVLRFEDDCIEMLDGTRLPVRQKDKNALFAHFTQYQFRHMRREL